MTNESKVGVISIGTPWFDVGAAQVNLDVTRSALAEHYRVLGPKEFLTSSDDLERGIVELAGADVLLLQLGTFPDGNAPARLVEALGVPTVVHSLPEPSLESGVPLNSLCGANMTTFTLSALGHPHSFVHADPGSATGLAKLLQHLRAGLTLAELRNQSLALVGFRAPGFYPCSFDELLLRRSLGLRLEYLDLGAVQSRFESGKRKKAPLDAFPTIEGGHLKAEAVASMEAYYAALTDTFEASGHDLVAIRDWPELEHFDPQIPGGLWPVLSWLQDDGIDLAPEGDVNGAVTMRVGHRLSEADPFFADISAWDDAESTLTLWHYGGPTNLARNRDEIRFGAEGRELEFTLKPGRGHLLRLGMKDNKLRLLSIAVEVLDERVTLRRAGARARTLDSPAGEVVRSMLDGGWEHHVTLVYGELTEAVRAFAKQAGLELAEL